MTTRKKNGSKKKKMRGSPIAKPKGPTRSQLAARNHQLKAALRIAHERLDLQEEIMCSGDGLRRMGEHWYRVVEYFDAHQIQRFPAAKGVHIMGMLQHAIVVEVPAGTDPAEMAKFSATLQQHGIEAKVLYVQAGVRFLKFATVSKEEEARLDAEELAKNEDAKKPGTDTEDSDSPGPESDGDGLGDSVSSDSEGTGGGCDRDEATSQERAPVPDSE